MSRGLTSLQLATIVVLQCFSTFYRKDVDDIYNNISCQHVSDFTGFSMKQVIDIMYKCADEHFITIADGFPLVPMGRLSPSLWKQNTSNLSYLYANFVWRAPESLRDAYSYFPIAPGLCHTAQPVAPPQCQTTSQTNFNGVYEPVYSDEACCPPPAQGPYERAFCAQRSIKCDRTMIENLWFLVIHERFSVMLSLLYSYTATPYTPTEQPVSYATLLHGPPLQHGRWLLLAQPNDAFSLGCDGIDLVVPAPIYGASVIGVVPECPRAMLHDGHCITMLSGATLELDADACSVRLFIEECVYRAPVIYWGAASDGTVLVIGTLRR